MVRDILEVLRNIPKGVAISYGEVARRAGWPRNARMVARVLHSLSDSQGIPWHRVINASGRISLPMDGAGALQAELLRREGMAVDAEGKVKAASARRGGVRSKGKGRISPSRR